MSEDEEDGGMDTSLIMLIMLMPMLMNMLNSKSNSSPAITEVHHHYYTMASDGTYLETPPPGSDGTIGDGNYVVTDIQDNPPHNVTPPSPYNEEDVFLSMVSGAGLGGAIGATMGILGGPFAEITVPVGAGVGALIGGVSGFIGGLINMWGAS